MVSGAPIPILSADGQLGFVVTLGDGNLFKSDGPPKVSLVIGG